ncbi:MAG: hypothetical protein M5U17_03285 [Ignavibacterium sp.]|nr:hypothetical protein [Ignavibacterium sp.]
MDLADNIFAAGNIGLFKFTYSGALSSNLNLTFCSNEIDVN